MMTEDRTAALLESLQIDVRLIAESHGNLDRRLERVETKVDALGTKVEVLEMCASATQRHLQRIDTRLEVLEEFAAGAHQRFERIDARFDALEGTLEAFATDAQQRFQRIETHLQRNGGVRPGAKRAARRSGGRTRTVRVGARKADRRSR